MAGPVIGRPPVWASPYSHHPTAWGVYIRKGLLPLPGLAAHLAAMAHTHVPTVSNGYFKAFSAFLTPLCGHKSSLDAALYQSFTHTMLSRAILCINHICCLLSITCNKTTLTFSLFTRVNLCSENRMDHTIYIISSRGTRRYRAMSGSSYLPTS